MKHLLIPAICALISVGSATHIHAAENADAGNDAPRCHKKISPETREKIFTLLDVNSNGSVNRQEFDNFKKVRHTIKAQNKEQKKGKKGERTAKMLKKFDSDGNGTLSDSERAAARQAHGEKMKTKNPKRFAKIDTNGNGTIEDSERKAAKKHCKKKNAPQDRVSTPEKRDKIFARIDTNNDGGIDRQEFAQARKDRAATKGQRTRNAHK